MSPSAQPNAAASEERRFVEDLGVFFESTGQPRMAGRVFAALLLADPPEMSAADLAEYLTVSSGSISMTTRELIRLGLVERVSVPGERRDYFRANVGALPQLLRERLGVVSRMHELMERGEELAKGKDPQVRRRLEEIHAFYEFFEGELEQVLARWDERRVRFRRR
ncbi:MAG TPA: MarR family transcriptional regulator [Actinomycetota bacterium]